MKITMTKLVCRPAILLVLAFCTCLHGAATESLQASSADTDYAEFIAQRNRKPPPELTREVMMCWYDTAMQELYRQGVAFYEKHPADPRRWELVEHVTRNAPPFVREIGPDFSTRGEKAIIVDETAKQAWAAKSAALWMALAQAKDVPPATREIMDWMKLWKDFRAGLAAPSPERETIIPGLIDRFHAHLKQYSGAGKKTKLVLRVDQFLKYLERTTGRSVRHEWEKIAVASGPGELRKHAEDKLGYYDMLGQEQQLSFTAVDGREVDLAKFRGKVVLIDFWATWCGPCIAELPNLKRVYAEYHARGLEIIGIALENGKLLPDDTPGQKAAKLVAAAKVLTEFTTKEQMTWPQYFDGKYWKTELAQRYNISAIPSMLLVDQDGLIVSTKVRGEKLEQEVKRLLKL